jgi:hypothetical protein
VIGSIGLASIMDKVKQNRRRRLGFAMRRKETIAVRVVMKINVKGKRRKERPKSR